MKVKMGSLYLTTVLFITFFLTPSLAFFRHLCHGQLGIGRVDPLMAPGKASQHVHNIQGAQSESNALDSLTS